VYSVEVPGIHVLSLAGWLANGCFFLLDYLEEAVIMRNCVTCFEPHPPPPPPISPPQTKKQKKKRRGDKKRRRL